MRIRIGPRKTESYPHATNDEHWTQFSNAKANESYGILALAVCEDAYILATQFDSQPANIKRELKSWLDRDSSECMQADPRTSFCLDVICDYFGWDLEAVRKSYVDATKSVTDRVDRIQFEDVHK